MFSPRAIFRVIYNSIYFVLCAITAALLLVTPGDIIYQAYLNNQWYNIWLLVSCVVGTLLIVAFIYALRLYNNKTILASIPKAWVPIEKGDVPKRVFKIITAGLDRSAAIAYEARPRFVPSVEDSDLDQQSVVSGAGNEVGSNEKSSKPKEGFQLLKVRKLEDVERMLGSPTPRERPVWGDIQHRGWAPPDSPDIPNLHYGTVVSELPHLIEAKALTLAPPDPTVDADPPVLDPEAVALMQRSPTLGLRQYLNHLAELAVLPMDATTAEFLTLYEHARFSARPISGEQFRHMMHLFAGVLRSMGPMDPAILDPVDDQATASDSDIDNYAPCDSAPTTPRSSSLSRSVTQSTTASQRRPHFAARAPSASTWHDQFRTAPSTLNAPSMRTISHGSSALGTARSRQPYHSSSNASLRSKASSNGSGSSVIRLTGRTDLTDLPYVLSMTDSR